MTMPRGLAPVLSTLAALAVSATAFLPVIASGHITRDSGVFLYTGMVVSRGGMPYTDSWDHKGPLLAVVEAVAWKVSGGVTGAPVLEAVFLFLGLSLAGLLWSRWMGAWAATLVLLTGVTYLAVYEGGNFTETWLFPFQLVAYSLAASVARGKGRDATVRLAALVGASVGLALGVGLFTRPNNVVGVLALAALGAIFFRRRVAFLGAITFVVAALGGALMLWLWSGNALRAFVDQYLRYNIFYSGGTSFGGRVEALATLSQLLVAGAVPMAALVMAGVWVVSRPGAVGAVSAKHYLFLPFLVIGALDALSQVMSGRPYPHYLVVAIGAFAVAVSIVGAAWPAPLMLPPHAPTTTRLSIARRGASIVLAIAIVTPSASAAMVRLHTTVESGISVTESYQAQIVGRVIQETTPDDRVLVHGAETWILAAAQRLSPTSITYSLPIEQGYPGLAEKYLAELTTSAPALIVESPLSCGISSECPPEKDNFDGLAPWVASNYRLEGDVVGFRFWKRLPG